MNFVLPQNNADAKVDGILKLAVMAVGGQGGGVLTGSRRRPARKAMRARQPLWRVLHSALVLPSTTSKWHRRAVTRLCLR